MTDNQIDAFCLVIKELKSAVKRYAPMNSAHEGLAVLQEEVHELMLEVYKSPKNRDDKAMKEEAVQVAAMAIRFLTDVCMEQDESEVQECSIE